MICETIFIFLPPFFTGTLILFTHLILGRQVLKRGIVFIDLAVAQVAAMGAVVSHLLLQTSFAQGIDSTLSKESLAFLMPFVFSSLCALVISTLSKKMGEELEAIIGCLYVLSAAITILLLSHDPHGTEHMSTTLTGHILWTDWEDLISTSVISILFLGLVYLKKDCLTSKLFYPLFAIMITFSVQLVGVYLVFSALIMPAISVEKMTTTAALVSGGSLGVLSIAAGFIASAFFDLPAGAATIAALSTFCFAFRVIRNMATKKQRLEQ